MYRNGYLLAASSVLSSALGLGFWALATATYEPEQVGIGAAAIAAMGFLANLASFNLVNSLNRFVPRAGRSTSRLIGRAYVVAGGAGLVAAAVFLAGLDVWAPSLVVLRETPWSAVWFSLATAAWVVFVIQDGALTGLRASSWVTVENLAFAVAKIGVLFVVASRLGGMGVFVAWTVPVIPVVLIVNLLMFSRLVPIHAAATADDAEEVGAGVVSRFAAGDYTASLVWQATTTLLPVIVLERSGAEGAAYFYLAWTVAYVLYLVGRNFGMSMLTESAADPAAAASLTYRTLRHTALLMVPAAAVLVVSAPLILRLFGSEYSASGSSLLRVLAVASVPAAVTTTYAAFLRARRRVVSLVVLMTVLGLLLLTGSWVLLDRVGLVGVGYAWLAAHLIVAIAVLVGELRTVVLANVSPRALNVFALARDRLQLRRIRRTELGFGASVLEGLDEPATSDEWTVLEVLPSVTDSRAVIVGGGDGRPRAIIKSAASEQGRASLERGARALDVVRNDPRLAALYPTIPRLLAVGETGGRGFVVEEYLGKVSGTDAGMRRDRVDSIVAAAVGWTTRLTAATASPTGAPERWFSRRRAVVLGQIQADADGSALLGTAESTAFRLLRNLEGRPAAFVHGDYWLGNLRLDEGTGVVGVIDWDAFDEAGPADLDLITLILTSRIFREGAETGQVVMDIVEGRSPWTDRERELLGHALDPDWAGSVDAVLLAWWQGAALNMEVSPRYRPGSPWFVRNFANVVEHVSARG